MYEEGKLDENRAVCTLSVLLDGHIGAAERLVRPHHHANCIINTFITLHWRVNSRRLTAQPLEIFGQPVTSEEVSSSFGSI